MLVTYCRLCRHCRNLAEGGCLLSRFHFTRCRYFMGHVACRNLPWQGVLDVSFLELRTPTVQGGGAVACAKHAQWSTMGNKIWLSMQPAPKKFWF